MTELDLANSVVNLVGADRNKSANNHFKDDKEEDEDNEANRMHYGIDDVPPWYLCVFIALQHYLTMIGAIVSIPFILTPALCMLDDDPARSQIISTMIFVTGIVTFFQVTFGCRLPIVQGGTISFLVPILAILELPQWECPSDADLKAMSSANRTEVWQVRMREISGAISVAAIVQVVIGYFGIIGAILKIVSPLTIVPTVSLVGLSLFSNAAEAASTQWGIAAGTIVLMTVFSQCCGNVLVPGFGYSRERGFHTTWFHLFRLFPVLLTILIMWAICGILTFTNVFPSGHPGRTDYKINILEQADWFRVPYPGQWGMPTVSVAGVLGMLAGVMACTVESISYYPTVARMCRAPPPPLSAINRGIGTEGLGTVLAGLWGSGNGTNTFGENVGAIGVTKVGSRRVIQYACVLMILQGVINKFGAIFIIIPQPVVGGIFCVMFGMITAFGLSALQYVDLNSPRNLYIIGFSIFFPLTVSQWMQANTGYINTGVDVLDNVLTVILSTSILIAGVVGCFLDNLLPGTPKERGIIAWSEQMKLSTDDCTQEKTTYDFPVGMGLVRRCTWLSYIPFMPTYKSGQWCR